MRGGRKNEAGRLRPAPVGAILLAVAALCFGLAVSAGYTYSILFQFRDKYLEKTGHDVAALADLQTRGPDRRQNVELWGRVLGDLLDQRGDAVAFLALLDGEGRLLAGAGSVPADVTALPNGAVRLGDVPIYVFDERVPTAQRPDRTPYIAGWRIRVGLFTSSTAFITRQAHIAAGVTAAVIVAMMILALYALWTLRRFVRLKAREESEREFASLGRMAASLAHEIRNPLGAMKGLTQIAQEKLPPDHGTQKLMQTVVSEAERLERLIGELLSFARPADPKMARVDLTQLAGEVIEMLQPTASEAGVILNPVSAQGSAVVRSDENGLKQVLLNVILNALDATPKGGTVSVSLRNRASKLIEIRVDDTGAGIGERDAEELFQPFTTTKAQGTGLGLAVSRRIVERLGGTITLANLPGAGARCAIVLRS